MSVAQRQIGKTLFAPLLDSRCRSAMFPLSRLHHQYQYHLHHERSPQTERSLFSLKTSSFNVFPD